MPTQIHFLNPDNPEEIPAVLRHLLEKTSNIPKLGLIVKVNEQGEPINLEITDEETLRSIALLSAIEP